MKMVLFVVALAVPFLFLAGHAPVRAASSSPVLVELFTSEGCSSCPPADAFLRQLDSTQPVPGAQLVVLSEHVDYWNQLGWKDPYSSRFFSDRQAMYAEHFINGTVYTPQMVVDGSAEVVGSDSKRARQLIEKARDQEKVPVSISSLSQPEAGQLRAHVEIPALPESTKARSGEVYAVLALNHAESQVLRGENEGSRLQHVAVAQSITRLGSVSRTKGFTQDASVKLVPGADPANLRLIVFVQEPGSGRVLGAALQQVSKK
jgi:hypothetical protein